MLSCSLSQIPTEAIYQQLEGHEGYLNGSYKRYTEQELAEYYKKGVKNLLVFETGVDEERIKQLENEIKIRDEKIVEKQFRKHPKLIKYLMIILAIVLTILYLYRTISIYLN